MQKNSKAERTKKLIKDTFMQIYSETNYFKITVKDICQRIGIHRTTFYLHYSNIDEVLLEIENEMLAEIASKSKETKYIIPLKNKNALNEIKHTKWDVLEYIKSQKSYLIPLLNPYGDLHFINRYKRLIFEETKTALERINASYGNNQDYIIRYLASGKVETIYYWLCNDDLTTEELTQILLKQNSMNPFLKLH